MTAADKLAYMANQIARAFATLPPDQAAAKTAEHINNFWEPRMRRQLFSLVAEAPDKFAATVHAAVPAIRPPPQAA